MTPLSSPAPSEAAASARRQRVPCFTSVALPAHTRPSLAPSSPASAPSPRRRPAPLTMVAANALPPSTRSNISRGKPPAAKPKPASSTGAKTATKKRPMPPAPRPSTPSTVPSRGSSAADGRGVGLAKGLGMCDARFTLPVPAAEPHEIEPARRGRNAQRRARYAEHFRRYLYLRRLLKPWSEAFRTRHGRTPSLVDVHDAEVPGLFDRFVEYLEALDGLRVEG